MNRRLFNASFKKACISISFHYNEERKDSKI